ncbi:MAG: tetratricopeptide repeat protein [Verrucomicrobiaceae bacterium]|nr:MAG: tetratricopeptide repeat protein [Verrucomicrobiaceae bacterium]
MPIPSMPMAIPTTIFLVLAFAASVLLGPQTRPWTWGPSLILLGVGLLVSLPAVMGTPRRLPRALAWLGTAAALWFVGRIATSPVRELALADLLLLFAIGASIYLARFILTNTTATRLFFGCLATLLAASLMVIARQVVDPSFSPIFHSRPADLPSGFFGHYNEGANFLIGTSFILACAAIRGSHPLWMRIFWGLVATGGFIGVHFTRSRGAILAVAVGFAAMAILFFLSSPKSKLKAALAISLPFVGILIGLFLWNGWNSAQQVRYNAGAETVLENPIRISLLDIATQCIGLMPWSGSGSRSFSWNCYRFWDVETHGGLSAKPEFVHNELFQAATDYGLVGLILLGGFLISAVLIATIRLAEAKEADDTLPSGMIVGGMTAFAGMMVQSNFSFVFHLFPGAILLGLSLGLFIWPSSTRAEAPRRRSIFPGLAIRTLVGITAVLVVAVGIQGSRAYACMWTAYFAGSVPPLAKAGTLSRAVRIYPSSELYKDLGLASQAAATTWEMDSGELKDQAISAYKEALRRNPYDPTISMNLAPLLAISGDSIEAEKEFKRIIAIQGGAESLLKGHFKFADYLLEKGIRQIRGKAPLEAMDTFQAAIGHTDEIRKLAPWVMPATMEGLTLDVSLHGSIALALEESGDIEKALEYYEFASKIQTGERVHYPWAVLLGNVAKTAWLERRPSEAMEHFQKARDLVLNSKDLPPDVTEEQKVEYLTYLENTIRYLKEAGIKPSDGESPGR